MPVRDIKMQTLTSMIVAFTMLLLAGEGAQAATFSYLDVKTEPCKTLTIASSGVITCNTAGTNDVPFNFAEPLICTGGIAINSTSGKVACATQQLPVCTLTASASQAVPGDTVVLTANCTNTPKDYQWTKADSLVKGAANTATVTLPTTATSAAYVYSVAGVNAQGTGNKASTVITVARASKKGAFAYIPHQGVKGGEVAVIDTSTNKIDGTPINVGVYPSGVAVSPDNTRVYVVNGDFTVSAIDAGQRAATKVYPVGQSPYGIAVNHAGSKVYVANTRSNTLSEINTATEKVVEIPVGKEPHGVAVNRSDSRVYVSNYADNTVSVVDTATGKAILPALAVQLQPEGVAVFGSRVFVANSGSNTLSIIDTGNANAIPVHVPVGKSPLGVAVNPAGTQVYVVNNGDRTVSIVDIATAKVVNTVVVGISPAFVAFDPTGALAYVTNQGEPTVSVIDTSAGVTMPDKIGVSPGALWGYGKFIGGNPENYRGLWWNPAESGWGMSLAQHNDMVFGAIYTYDQAGQPAWYVMSSCPLLGSSCTGEIYKVTGATSPLVAWNASSKVVASVGSGTLAFTDADNASFTFTIEGKAGSKAITRQKFKDAGSQANTDYTDLWWNEAESGWGVQLTQQYDTIFATWYAYDEKGNPVWYVASDCKMSASGCTGGLYQVAGGAALTAPWSVPVVTQKGTLSFTFSDPSNGVMEYVIGNQKYTRNITRQVF